MLKKIFLLWNNHEIGFTRVLFALLIPAALSHDFAMFYCNFQLWLIILIAVGEKEKWGDE